ncbi:Retrotransposon gag protein [Corchorus olitorius]|uniref:Retrotransposon gag protein n=1 Tax=Corchorus olitorius TaxID=93759 RepID=A0A1R3IKM6_9ROSI|nr:Retrotransposon gag protein [Corchorus olitorius]
MPPKSDAAITEAIHAITESLNAQLQELRSSQLEFKTSLENKIDSTLNDLHYQISQLNLSNSQKSPSTTDTYKGVLSAKPTPNLPTPSTSVFQPKTPKYFLTHFDGSNVHAWIFQVEQYFSFYSIAPDQRIPIAGFFMTGEALTWIQWMHRNGLLTDWDSFTRELEVRFGPSIFLNPQTALFKLKQTSTVTHYQREFELLSNRVAGFTDEHLLNLFISGLRHDIQSEVIIQNPQRLSQALALAKLYEAKLADNRTTYRAPALTSSPSSLPPRHSTFSSTAPPPKALPPSAGGFPIRRLTASEMQARRSKGLCFNCDDQFNPGHRCKTTPFLVLQCDEEAMESAPPLSNIPTDLYPPSVELSALPLPPPPSHSPEFDSNEFQVSLHALYGHSSQSCMKLVCFIKGHLFTVLIDSGSTHNLLQSRVARHLGLLIEPAPPLSVKVGNGDVLHCSGMISTLPFDLQGVNFTLDLYLLDVHGADVILGCSGWPNSAQS